MYVIVVGCGRVGSDLAGKLSRDGHEVTVIDYVGSSFVHLDPEYRGRTIEAEPLAEGVLQKAGIERADAVAAVTSSDTTNAVVARIAKAIYDVPTVVSRNFDPRWMPLHEAMGIQVISSTLWAIDQMSHTIETSGGRA
jgi:trk system potassium uptake protein